MPPLFFDHTKGDICDVVIYIIARTNVFWGITGQAKVSNTHAIFFMTFDVYIIWHFVFFLSTQNVLCWDSVIYIIARLNLRRRYVYKFVTYITLSKSRGDFDITHVFSLTAKKVAFVTFLCMSSHKDMCSEVLLAKQRYCNTHAFFHDFWCVYNMTFVFSFVHAKCVMFETVLYT